ncbi:MAG: hypothetical protein HY784_15325 [Chloroflexi bacterium]|nr:hypothetical protein [Chloroflexota bacterium]
MPPLAVGIVFLSTFMHAGWNLIVREQRATDIFLRTLLVIGVVGIGPALAAEFLGTPVLATAGTYLLLAGLFQGLYFLGLTLGYRTGEFTVVYPLARALPVLLVAISDLIQGNAPTPLGWLGIGLVSTGCVALPLDSARGFKLSRYWNRATGWTLLTALATVGYTVVDSAAARVMPRGLSTALSYGLFETFLSLIAYGLILAWLRHPMLATGQPAAWPRTCLVAALLFGAYALVLWAYQLSAHASYVIALRQFSIVIGVVAGSLLFREPAPGLRIAAALTITLGGVCIALAR